jgi:propionate CoA-transferase
MDFRPLVHDPRLMDERIFRPEPMGLREQLLALPLDRRFSYDPELNLFFINFERLTVKTPKDIEEIREQVERKLRPLGKKVYAIVNYDNFSIFPDMVDAYTEMVKHLVDHYYWGVTRYTTSGFLRLKLGDALARRGLAPHIFESAEEARKNLLEVEARAR